MKDNNKTPRTLKGFNDYFGKDSKLRDYIRNTFKETYERYGYEPLETPSLEYSELMLGQSGEEAEKQYYRFEDNGGRDVMLKFEVMISMCRALAQNINEITFPYKRYQIQPVWRAENVQKGRYREFTQMDADIIGVSSMNADAELIQIGIEILDKLGFKNFKARISNRKFLEGLAEYLGISQDKFYGFSISIDKLEKIGKEKVIEELIEKRDIGKDQATEAMDLLDSEKYSSMNFKDIVEAFRKNVGSTIVGQEGLDELIEIYSYLENAGVSPERYLFDITIARGLASYTGPVWEYTILDGNVGSVGGAGRYDKAIGKYIGQDYPATGMSFGLERLMDVMKNQGMVPKDLTAIDVLVTVFSKDTIEKSIKLAKKVRDLDKSTLLYPEFSKLDKQLKYADRKEIPYVIILGPDEIESGKLKIRNMLNGNETEIDQDELSNFFGA